MLTRWYDFHRQNHRNFSNAAFWSDALQQLQGFQRELGHIFDRTSEDFPLQWGIKHTQSFNMNLYDRPDHLLLVAEVPGLKQEDLELQANAKGITIKASRQLEVPENVTARRQERNAFSFQRSLAWPVPIQVDGIEATLRDGMLQLKVPKAPEVQPRSIEVKVA